MKERRRFDRWPCWMPCKCRGRGASFDGKAVDLSYGGAGVVEPSKLPSEGAEISITFRPDKEKIKVNGRIAWICYDPDNPSKATIGISFSEKPSATSAALEALLP